MSGTEIEICPKCNKWRVIEPPKEPMPQDSMEKQDIKKCSCDEQLKA